MSPDFANPVSALLDMIESELNDGTIASVAVTVCSSTGLPTRSATLLYATYCYSRFCIFWRHVAITLTLVANENVDYVSGTIFEKTPQIVCQNKCWF